MSNTNNPAHHREAFLALLEQEPPGVDYTSWLHGLCVGWRGAKALPAAPTVANVAASDYVPKVGDVVRVDAIALTGDEYVVLQDSRGEGTTFSGHKIGSATCDSTILFDWRPPSKAHIVYVRPSTDAEKRAAGLAVPPPAPTPAPEAKRDGYDTLTDAEGRDIAEAIDRTRAERAAFDKDDAPEAKRPECPLDLGGCGSSDPSKRWCNRDGDFHSDDFGNKAHECEPGCRVCDFEPFHGPDFSPAPCPPPVAGMGEKSVDAGLLEECADALTALLSETEELSLSTFPTREWARAAVRNAYRAIGREVKS